MTEYHTGVAEAVADQLVSAARTGLGDSLRSVVYFTPSKFDVLYVRKDLYTSAEALDRAKSTLVDPEIVGFAEASVRRADRGDDRSDIGRYGFTVRVHDDGYVLRVLDGDRGVLATTDSMDVDEFEETAVAIRKLLG
ncbi:DUF7522 family protein [Salinigranum salinum]|uniref:DUF7522 family protein n=1 Tax=Salinigranum salinum TaxID=1364937 RepID=UPI001260C0EF|nr:hypothetical protein [Salinigranum salinum]